MTGWTYDADLRLGSGGFGTVFEGRSPDGMRVAAKIIPNDQGSGREQVISDELPASPYIVPILHVELDGDNKILYMPRADYSLREHMELAPALPDCVRILTDIALGLSEISGRIIHRDLKPDNILFLNGHWAICDFGISRISSAETSTNTHKFSRSAPYASPEQWRGDKISSASDIYSFGVLAYELIAGHRPFLGTSEELRQLHLHDTPETLAVSRRAAWLVSECLLKAPEARPTAANIVSRLQRFQGDVESSGARSLASAQTALMEERAAELAQQELEWTETERRALLHSSAEMGFQAIKDELLDFVADAAPLARFDNSTSSVTITLGQAKLTLRGPYNSDYRPGTFSQFDVISHGEIRLELRGYSRSHSLYFANFQPSGSYAWFELAFMDMFGGADFNNSPRAEPPERGLGAFSNVIGGLQLAWGVKELSPGDPDAFIQYWSEKLGQAATGHFPRVSTLPDGLTRLPGQN